MAYFVTLRTGERFDLPSVKIPLLTQCDWINAPYGKKGTFSQSFELANPALADKFHGSVKSNELRYSERGCLTVGQRTFFGFLYIVNNSKGKYSCSFVETANELYEQNVNELATIRNGAYNDIFLTYDGAQSKWVLNESIATIAVQNGTYVTDGSPNVSVRVDAVLTLINANYGTKFAIHEWMTRIWVLTNRNKIYSAFAPDAEVDFDPEQVGDGTKYGIFFNLPKVTLYDFLAKCAFCAGYATYVDGDVISYISFTDLFNVSDSKNVKEYYVSVDNSTYGVVKSPLGYVKTNLDTIGRLQGVRANGTDMSSEDGFTIDVNFSTDISKYVTTEYDADTQTEVRSWKDDNLAVDAVNSDITPYVSTYVAFLDAVANNPKKLKLTLIGTHWNIYDKLYVPQLNAVVLPLKLTKNNNYTVVEGVTLTEFDPNDVLQPEYVFHIGDGGDEDMGFETYINIAPSDNQDACGDLKTVYANSTSLANGSFRPYILTIEWADPLTSLSLDCIDVLIDANAEVERNGMSFVIRRNNVDGYGIEIRSAAERIKVTVKDLQQQLTDSGTFAYVDIVPSVSSATLQKLDFTFVNNGGKTYDTFHWKFKSAYGNGGETECGMMPITATATALGCNTLTQCIVNYFDDYLTIDVPTNNGIDLERQSAESDPRDLVRGYMPSGVVLTVVQSYNGTTFNTYTETVYRNPNGTSYGSDNFNNVNLPNVNLTGSRSAKEYFTLSQILGNVNTYIWLSLNGDLLAYGDTCFFNSQMEMLTKLQVENTISASLLNTLTDGFRKPAGETNFNRFLDGVTAYPYASRYQIQSGVNNPNISIATDDSGVVPGAVEIDASRMPIYIAFVQPIGRYFFNIRDWPNVLRITSTLEVTASDMMAKATFKGKIPLYKTYSGGSASYELCGTFEKRQLTNVMQNCVRVNAEDGTITAFPLIMIDNTDRFWDSYTLEKCYLKNLTLKLLFSQTQLDKEM